MISPEDLAAHDKAMEKERAVIEEQIKDKMVRALKLAHESASEHWTPVGYADREIVAKLAIPIFETRNAYKAEEIKKRMVHALQLATKAAMKHLGVADHTDHTFRLIVATLAGPIFKELGKIS